jgi:hypothetical protein
MAKIVQPGPGGFATRFIEGRQMGGANFSSHLEIFCHVRSLLKLQTFPQRKMSGENPVNNSSFNLSEQFDSIGQFELFATCSRVVFGGQPVYINSLSVLEFQL